MLAVLESLLDLLLVLGSSIWGWLGVVLGFAAAYLTWSMLAPFPLRGPASAVAFVAVFMACAWQELRREKRK